MILGKLGIDPKKQNTLIQNLKQVRSFQSRQIALFDMNGKVVYSGTYKNMPKPYLDIKVKSVNKSLGNPKVLAYVMLGKQAKKEVYPIEYKGYYIHQLPNNDPTKQRDMYTYSKEKQFKMRTGLPLSTSVLGVKEDIDLEIKKHNASKEMTIRQAKEESYNKEAREKYDREHKEKGTQRWIAQLRGITINNYLDKEIRVDRKYKRTISIQRLSDKMYRVKVSKSKWVQYTEKQLALRLYNLIDLQKLDILKWEEVNNGTP